MFKIYVFFNFKFWVCGDNNILKLFNFYWVNKNDVWKYVIGYRCDRSRYIIYIVLFIYLFKKLVNFRIDYEYLYVLMYVDDIFEYIIKILSK